MDTNKAIIHWVEQAKQGDLDAFERLVHHHKAMLYRIGVNMLKSDEDTADAIQETLLLAYKNIHKLKENQYFRTWLVRILINECKKILRHKKKCALIESVSTERPFYPTYPIEHELNSYIHQLDFKLQQVIYLKYYEEFKIREIKQILHIPESTIKTRLTKAKKQLYYLLMKEGV